jgi:hypothetical protein
MASTKLALGHYIYRRFSMQSFESYESALLTKSTQRLAQHGAGEIWNWEGQLEKCAGPAGENAQPTTSVG